ncbi:MAG: hypothetical protein INR73_20700 [Williamsia sp.]|nr:hypothetical protein [Williamsia sp.]
MQAFLIGCVSIPVLLMPGNRVYSQSGFANKDPAYTITKKVLSIEDGLASHEVFCGLQDQAGFMWFGTRNGLNRYDGEKCLLFTRQRNNLQENKVVQLAKDDADNLFIEYGSTGFQLTTNGKVDVMNVNTQRVTTLTAAFPNMPFKERDVYWLADDGTGDVNFLTAHPFRFWKYNAKRGFTLRLEMKDWSPEDVFPFNEYRSTGPLCMFGNGTSLLKVFNQATQYLVAKDKVVAFKQADALRSLPVGFTDQSRLLITYNTKTASNAFAVAQLTDKGYLDPAVDLKQNNLNRVKGRYWYQVVSDANHSSSMFYDASDALYLWNRDAFLKVISKSELKSFENLFMYELVSDNFGNRWLCTSIGVVKLKIEKNRFVHYFTSEQQSIQKNSQARGIYADENGEVGANIWTHTFLQMQDRIHYTYTADEIKYALTSHHATLFCGGYNLFDFDNKKNNLTICPGGEGSEIWSMYSLNDSLLLLGRTNGFYLFNSNTKRFDSVHYSGKSTPEAKFVYRFFNRHNDTIWAIAENGLYRIERNKGGQWSIAGEQPPFIKDLNLLDAYAGENGTYWLATNGEGLYRWDGKARSFRQFTITSGFPSDVLYRIEPDDYGNIWISSDNGLVRFNTKTFATNTYTTSDGISHNEFNRTSSFRATDGRLFFGGIDGVNAFYPKDFLTDTNALNAPLRIIAFNQFVGAKNQLVSKTTGLSDALHIVLAPEDKFFTLEFQLLDFANDYARHFAYQIEGVDKGWNYFDENSLRISGLPYGTFNLRIKAQTCEGAWSKKELQIPVTVLKPFYLKWWFILSEVIVFLLVVYLIIYFRIKQLAADKKRLEEMVNEKTAQLKQSVVEQSALLEEKDILMKEIHHRVKNNLQVISGLLELQSKALVDEKARNALREGRNRVRSIALIHQNLYQFENISTIEVERFVKDLCRQVDTVFDKHTKVQMNIEVPSFYLDIDTAVPLGLIMNELLSNSFKYAFQDAGEGRIDIKINTTGEGTYQLVYADNGPGLPAYFDLRTATTLGIQLINDLARQIGGHVKCENRNGAMFIINFTNRNIRKSKD